MAAPHVTGAIALLKAWQPTLSWSELRNLLLTGGDSKPGLVKTVSGKRLNVYGAMTCSNQALETRLLPVASSLNVSAGTPVELRALNVTCASPAGDVTVNVAPNNIPVVLRDDGVAPDVAAGDGVYTAVWTPTDNGSYTLQFPGGDNVSVLVLAPYYWSATPYQYRTITGTNLNLGDDQAATVTPPFAVRFGGQSFSKLFISSNGLISFDRGVFRRGDVDLSVVG
jgi:hypothetical protein